MSIASLIPLLSALAATGVADLNPAQLDSATVAYRSVPREYQLDGVVEAVQQTTVSAQTQGQVQEILFDVDDFVEAGTVIARIKDTEHRSRVAQATAELNSAEATLKNAHEEFDRIKELFNKKMSSESVMDKAIADVKNAQARVESATAALEQSVEQLEYTQVRAPYSGLVTRRHLQVGEMANPGQALMTGIALRNLRVSVDVPQNLIQAVRDGQGARIHLPGGALVAATRMTVFPFADQGSNTFKVRLDLPPELADLYPGMFVKTGFITGEKRELAIPKPTVVYRSEVTGVYVLADGRISFRQIRLGRDLGDAWVVVLSGLTEGERVALDPIAAGTLLKARAGERSDG